jgi:lysophospholipase L1-like esterase
MNENWRRTWRDRIEGKPTVLMLLVGDSTVCDWPQEDVRRGWGQYLQEYFSPSLEVVNHARSGRSTKTFIREGLWAKALAQKPDYVLIHSATMTRTNPPPNRPMRFGL